MNKKTFLKKIKEYYANNIALMERKNKDYTGDKKDSAFRAFELVEFLGICSVEKGIVVRMCDKISRLATLLDDDARVLDEKIGDTLDDIANYSMILKAFLEQKTAK
jgi:hypothetical protein